MSIAWKGSGYVPIRVARLRCDHRGVRLLSRRFVRRHDGRIVAGVAVGLGDALDVDVNVVRCGFLVLTLAGGVALSCTAPPGCSCAADDTDLAPRPSDAIATAAFASVVLGLLLLVRAIGPWPGGRDRVAARRGDDRPGTPLDPSAQRFSDPRDWPFLDRLPPDAADAVAVLVGTRRGVLGADRRRRRLHRGRVGRVQFPSLS